MGYQPVCTGGDRRRTKRCCCYPTKMKLLICGIIFAVCCIGTGVGWSLFPYPLHASCKIDWTTQLSCDATYQKIYSQIFAWNHTDCGMVKMYIRDVDTSLYKMIHHQ